MDRVDKEQQQFILQDKRKIAIKAALLRLKQKNEGYMEALERQPRWRKIYNGLLFNNVQSELVKLVKLELCPADQNDRSYFNPFEKIPISMCYNKFNKEEEFEEHAIYNLVLLYDSRIKRDMNWNKIEETAKSTIRALHIADICKRNDRPCFQREIEKRVLNKERFKGQTLDFDSVYESGVADMAPISQITYN